MPIKSLILENQKRYRMTLHLDFSKSAKPEQLQLLAIWLQEMVLIKSFKISDMPLDEIEVEGEPDTDSFVDDMLKKAEDDIANGRTYASDEAKKLVEKWLKQRQ